MVPGKSNQVALENRKHSVIAGGEDPLGPRLVATTAEARYWMGTVTVTSRMVDRVKVARTETIVPNQNPVSGEMFCAR